MKCVIATPCSIYELGQRANQEDSIYPIHGKATSDDSMFVVCDGMGGHESGEVASSTVCEVMSSYINANSTQESFDINTLQAALHATYDALDEKDSGAAKKMGTTMTFMKLYKEGCILAHIGDSRIYHVRPATKEMLYKSRDHSLVNDLYDVGEITLEEMKTSRQKNVITRAVQPHQTRRAKADVKYVKDIKAGDFFYLCTDGMLEEMEDENIVNILSMNNSDAEKVRILTELTVDNRDNHSAYLIRIEQVFEDKKLSPKVMSAEQEVYVDEPDTKGVLEQAGVKKNMRRERSKPNLLLIGVMSAALIIVGLFFGIKQFSSKPAEHNNDGVEMTGEDSSSRYSSPGSSTSNPSPSSSSTSTSSTSKPSSSKPSPSSSSTSTSTTSNPSSSSGGASVYIETTREDTLNVDTTNPGDVSVDTPIVTNTEIADSTSVSSEVPLGEIIE